MTWHADALADDSARSGAPLLDAAVLARLADILPEWTVAGKQLSRRFVFPDFASALQFANRIGEVAEAQNHHPELRVGWGQCTVSYTTHDAGGLTRNDLICAAKIDRLPHP